jgi:nucleoside triphosphate pyrophosphatase
MRLVLASASPRRRELLRQICPAFEVVPSEIEETLDERPTQDAVVLLALRKARAVTAQAAGAAILAADTVVVIDRMALGKPPGAREAREMLTRLRGRQHEVVTGLAVVEAGARREATTAVVSRVLMASYPDATIEAYVASGSPLDKAGGYAIQDLGGQLVDAVVGSYTNVVGLPLAATRRLLGDFGVAVSERAAP